MEHTIERLDSCEISINAKGLFSGKVKVYCETVSEAMSKALDKANTLRDVIKQNNDSTN